MQSYSTNFNIMLEIFFISEILIKNFVVNHLKYFFYLIRSPKTIAVKNNVHNKKNYGFIYSILYVKFLF